jgi:hypothetical protein
MTGGCQQPAREEGARRGHVDPWRRRLRPPLPRVAARRRMDGSQAPWGEGGGARPPLARLRSGRAAGWTAQASVGPWVEVGEEADGRERD